VARCVRERFGALPDGGAAPASSPPRARSTVVSRAKKELEQVHLCLGTASYSQTHDGRFAAYVLNTVLGGGLSSRLFQNIREQRGLVYSIASGISAYSDAGALTIYAGTGMETVDEVLRLTMDELRRLRDEPLPPDELRRAKDHLKGGLVLSLESTSSRMSHLARQEIYFERQLSLDDVLASIEAVDVEAVSLAARELLGGELTLSLVGNMGRYRPKAEAIRL
jgi:predicted Zn-dependent peptidase